MSKQISKLTLDEVTKSFYDFDIYISTEKKLNVLESIFAYVKPETQKLLQYVIRRLNNNDDLVDEIEWDHISNRVSLELAKRANERERSLSGTEQGDLLEQPFASIIMAQFAERDYIGVKIVPNLGNKAGFDIYCINYKTRKAVIIELKNWSRTTKLQKDNVGVNYLEKRLVTVIDGIQITVECEILVMFGGHITSPIQSKFESDGVRVIHDLEKIRPDSSLIQDGVNAQLERIQKAVKDALDIIEHVLGLKRATGLNLSTTLYKVGSDGSVAKSRAIQNPTFNDEYITTSCPYEESKETVTVRSTIEERSKPVSTLFSAVTILKSLLCKPPD